MSNTDLVGEMLDRKLGSGTPEVAITSPFLSLSDLKVVSSANESLVRIVAGLWSVPAERLSPGLREIPRSQMRVSHLDELLEVAQAALDQGKLSLACEFAKGVLNITCLSLRSQKVHPEMFSNKAIFSTEGIKAEVVNALERRLASLNENNKDTQLTNESLVIARGLWNKLSYASIGHIEEITEALADEIDSINCGTSASSADKRQTIINLISIANEVVCIVNRFHGEGCRPIGVTRMHAQYDTPVPTYLVEHSLLMATTEDLEVLFETAEALIYFGSPPNGEGRRPEGLTIGDLNMNHYAMWETGRQILRTMYRLKTPVDPRDIAVLAAYDKRALDLPDFIAIKESEYYELINSPS